MQTTCYTLSYFPEPKLCISSNLKLKISLLNTDVLIIRTDTVLIWHYLLYECSSYFYAALSYTFVLFLESSLHFVCPLWVDPFRLPTKREQKNFTYILIQFCPTTVYVLTFYWNKARSLHLYAIYGYFWAITAVNWVVPTRIT